MLLGKQMIKTISDYTINIPSGSPVTTINSGLGIDEHTISVDGTFSLNGRDVEKRMAVIEKVLGIPERDPELEDEYTHLKEMYDNYIKELSKLRMWGKLK
jgi:hypothetical protein